MPAVSGTPKGAMIGWVKFVYEQRRIQRCMDKNSRERSQAVDKARAEGASAEELHAIGYDFFPVRKLAEDEMILLNHTYYVRLAYRLLIPVPKFTIEGGDWIESESQPGKYHLTPEALHELRASIRREKKERREGSLIWLAWLAALTGFVGALTGLLAIYTTFV